MTRAVISTLTPGTEYSFTVVATSEEMLGQQALAKGRTLGRVDDQGNKQLIVCLLPALQVVVLRRFFFLFVFATI